MNIEQLKQTVISNPEALLFEDTMAVIEQNYVFNETGFHNGSLYNSAGENSGSCRLLAFARLNHLTKEQTLYCFGQYYREVLQTPDADTHQNIRQFMQTGWSEVSFDKAALKDK